MSTIDDELDEANQEQGSRDSNIGHRLYSKEHLDYHTEITSPDAMSAADMVVLGIVEDEFEGTGFDKDFKVFLKRKRINYVANRRGRAGETERIAEAAAIAKSQNLGDELRRSILGDVNK